MNKYFLIVLLFLTPYLKIKAQETVQPTVDTVVDSTAFDTHEDDAKAPDAIPTVSLDEDDNLNVTASPTISSVLTAGRDPFASAVSFNFSIARFNVRGYEQDYFGTLMNGVPMENLENGFSAFGLWSGLNDMTRSKESTLGIRTTTFAFGELGGTTHIDSRASKQRKQLSVSYALSNRSYDNRIVASYGTGVTKKGWAVAISVAGRWAKEGYIKGTSYQSLSYFTSIEKKLGDRNSLALTVFGAPTKNGRSTASTQEVYDIVGDNYYNPNWGYQAGKVRNARIGYTHQPVMILTHEVKLKKEANLLTAASYSFGQRNVSGLDWYHAADPRPDYYRYLPSYFLLDKDSVNGQATIDIYKSNPELLQIQWDNLFDDNRSQNTTTVKNANGVVGNDVTGKRAIYVVSNRVQDYKRANFNTTYNKSFNGVANLSGGLSYQWQRINYRQELVDLLGGDFWLDQSNFADRTFPGNDSVIQNDLLRPNRIVKVGDQYGYNYDINVHKSSAWMQMVHKYSHFDLFWAGEFSNTTFWRDGKTVVGLFPTNSYGKSKVNTFFNYAFKGGITAKINGKNYLYANAMALSKAPNYEDVFLSPRTRSSQIENPDNEKIYSFEAGYIFNAPKVKMRASGYYTNFDNGTKNILFYDDRFESFGNMNLSNIDKVHYGGELAMEYKIIPELTLSAVAAVGRYYFNSRQIATFTVDNTSVTSTPETIYSKNFKVAGTPEEAYNIGLNYRGKQFWWVSVNGNMFRNAWEEFSPTRRTQEAVDLIDRNSQQFKDIIYQNKLYDNKKLQYTIDFSAGYSMQLNKYIKKMKHTQYVVFNIGVNNITNNKTIKTGGREQLRYDDLNRNPSKFDTKYFYAYGINYFASLTYRF